MVGGWTGDPGREWAQWKDPGQKSIAGRFHGEGGWLSQRFRARTYDPTQNSAVLQPWCRVGSSAGRTPVPLISPHLPSGHLFSVRGSLAGCVDSRWILTNLPHLPRPQAELLNRPLGGSGCPGRTRSVAPTWSASGDRKLALPHPGSYRGGGPGSQQSQEGEAVAGEATPRFHDPPPVPSPLRQN